MDFVDRAGRHALGRAVKLADLRDNMDLSRFEGRGMTDADAERVSRYAKAAARL